MYVNPKITNRQFSLSPAVESSNDRECNNNDFYSESDELVELGKFGYGIRLCHSKTNIPYIVLNLSKSASTKPKVIEKINNTLDLMYRGSSPYLLRLLNHYEEPENLFLIMENYDGDLLETLIEKGKCDINTCLKYIKEIILGIQDLQNNGLYNISIMPEFILIGDCVKLTDYGLKFSSKNASQKSRRKNYQIKIGNTTHNLNCYTSPEEVISIKNKSKFKNDKQCDLWYVGILLYEMVTKFSEPFKCESEEELCNSILNCQIDLSKIENKLCRDIIEKLVKREPGERAGFDDILNIEEMRNVDIEEPIIDLHDNVINPKEDLDYYIKLYGEKIINQKPNQGNANEGKKGENKEPVKGNSKSNVNLNTSQSNAPNFIHSQYDYDSDMMKSLRNENTLLQKQIEEIEYKISIRSSKVPFKPSISFLHSKNNNKNIFDSNEYDNNDDDSISDIDPDMDVEQIRDKVKKLQTKYKNLKEKSDTLVNKNEKKNEDIKIIKENIKKLKETISQNNKQVEKLNQETEKNLEEIKKNLNFNIDVLQLNKKELKNLIKKLIEISKKENKKLIDEGRNLYRTEISSKFEEKINSINKIIYNMDDSGSDKYETQINDMKEKIDELLEFKYKFLSDQANQNKLNAEIENLIARNEIQKEKANCLEIENELVTSQLREEDIKKLSVLNNINKCHKFINVYYPNLQNKFDESIKQENLEKMEGQI